VRRKYVFYVLLGVATLAMSEFFDLWRAWRAAPTLDAAAAVVGMTAGLLGLMLCLGFVLYEADRAAGRIRRPVALYEWVLARRAADRSRTWSGRDAAGPGGGRGAA